MDQPQKKNWFGRNWKWVVPVGCATPIVLCGGGLTLIFVLVFGAIKSSDVYVQALAKAKSNPQVVAAFGQPIEPGMMVSGNLNSSGNSGQADLAIPISGPKASGTIYLNATKSAGQWTFSTLRVTPNDSGQSIDLLEKP